MKKVIIILALIFFINSNSYADDFASLGYSSHNGDFNNIKDNTRLDLDGYIFSPKKNSLDFWTIPDTPTILNRFVINDSNYSTWLLQNGIYSLGGVIDFSNSAVPIGLFYKDKTDISNMKKISVKYNAPGYLTAGLQGLRDGTRNPWDYDELSKNDLNLIGKGLPVFFNKTIYDQVTQLGKSSILGYLDGWGDKKSIQLSGVVRDFYDSGSAVTCGSGNNCYYEMLPVKEEFVETAGSCNEMTKETFVDKFLKIWSEHGLTKYSIKTKIFVADKIVVNGVDIMSLNSPNNKVVNYGTGKTNNLNEKQIYIYNTISDLAISKLKKGKFCEVEKLSEKIEQEKSHTFNNNQKFLSLLYDRINYILKIGNPESKKKLEYKKSLELNKILDELRNEHSSDVTFKMLFGDLRE